MDWPALLIPAVFLYRVFGSRVPYAGVPLKIKVLHALALLFLFFCFFDVPNSVFWLIGSPSQVFGAQYVAVGIFPPICSLLIFCCNVAAGIFTLICGFAMAWGDDRARKRFVSWFPATVTVIGFDMLKAAEKSDTSLFGIVFGFVFVALLLLLVYRFYTGAQSEFLFPAPQ